jgi:hypothetical protein
MDIYILLDYVANCKRNKIVATRDGLFDWKDNHWKC